MITLLPLLLLLQLLCPAHQLTIKLKPSKVAKDKTFRIICVSMYKMERLEVVQKTKKHGKRPIFGGTSKGVYFEKDVVKAEAKAYTKGFTSQIYSMSQFYSKPYYLILTSKPAKTEMRGTYYCKSTILMPIAGQFSWYNPWSWGAGQRTMEISRKAKLRFTEDDDDDDDEYEDDDDVKDDIDDELEGMEVQTLLAANTTKAPPTEKVHVPSTDPTPPPAEIHPI